MSRRLLGFTALALFLLFVPAAFASQYPPLPTLTDLIEAERQSQTTLQVEITVNNTPINVLNIGGSPSGEVDRRGYNILEIEPTQAALPIVGSFPAGLMEIVTLSLEGTDFEWDVQVDADGIFLTDFPLTTFPPGEYYLTLQSVRVLRVIIPDNFDPQNAS